MRFVLQSMIALVCLVLCASCGDGGTSPDDKGAFILNVFGPMSGEGGTGGLAFNVAARVDGTKGEPTGILEDDWRFICTRGGSASWELNRGNYAAVLGNGASVFFAPDVVWPSAAHVDLKGYGLPTAFRQTHACDAVKAIVHVRDSGGHRFELSGTASGHFY
jgi:hypothetical protein